MQLVLTSPNGGAQRLLASFVEGCMRRARPVRKSIARGEAGGRGSAWMGRLLPPGMKLGDMETWRGGGVSDPVFAISNFKLQAA